ncbi:hypothetical protein EMCRGX_G026484 [Ephydatia muelleri]
MFHKNATFHKRYVPKTLRYNLSEVSSWLDRNQTAEKGEYEDKQKELEKVCMPIMTKCTRQEVCPMEQEECQEVHLGVLGVEARRVKVLPLRKWTKSLNLDSDMC